MIIEKCIHNQNMYHCVICSSHTPYGELVLKRIEQLEEHKNRQIDENRKVSRKIDELEEKIKDMIKKDYITASSSRLVNFGTFNIEKKEGLSFIEASTHLRLRKIKRKCWSDGSYVQCLNFYPNTIKIHNGENFVISLEDIEANDWEIVE